MKIISRLSPIALLCCLVFVAACERDDNSKAIDEAPELTHSDISELDADQIIDLVNADEHYQIGLDVGRSEIYPSCREIFEKDGEILPWPVIDEEIRATIFGCQPSGYLELDGGRRAIAYEIAMAGQERATDLRLVLYDADGDIAWHHRMDRSHEQQNFAANYRGSFLTAIHDRVICTGTMWNARTQALCVHLNSGEIAYDGRMGFWAGVEPFAYDGSLFSADLNGITRRYPYSGNEMRHRSFDARGGRAGFYATDQERIFFVPSEGDPRLTGWALDTLRPIWHTELSDIPDPGYKEISALHELLFLRVDDTLLGINTGDGALRMAFAVGNDHPRIVFSEDELYLLLRRDEQTPVLYGLNPTDGTVRWSAPAPSGTLNIAFSDGELMVRTVRTVRTVRPVTEPDDE